MSKKALKIKDLSRNRNLELRYLCLQYDEMKHKLQSIDYGLKAVEITGMPSSHRLSNVTEETALKRINLTKKLEAIEQSAIEADPEIYKYILKAVANDLPYEYLSVPCGRRQFYEKRKLFFALLDKKV